MPAREISPQRKFPPSVSIPRMRYSRGGLIATAHNIYIERTGISITSSTRTISFKT